MIFDVLSKTSTSMFRGLSWESMHDLAKRRWPMGHCKPLARQCDMCRGATHLPLALIIWEALDDLHGRPSSMSAAAKVYQSPRFHHVSFRPAARLLRAGGYNKLSKIVLARSENCVKMVDYSANVICSDTYFAYVIIPSHPRL